MIKVGNVSINHSHTANFHNVVSAQTSVYPGKGLLKVVQAKSINEEFFLATKEIMNISFLLIALQFQNTKASPCWS